MLATMEYLLACPSPLLTMASTFLLMRQLDASVDDSNSSSGNNAANDKEVQSTWDWSFRVAQEEQSGEEYDSDIGESRSANSSSNIKTVRGVDFVVSTCAVVP